MGEFYYTNSAQNPKKPTKVAPKPYLRFTTEQFYLKANNTASPLNNTSHVTFVTDFDPDANNTSVHQSVVRSGVCGLRVCVAPPSCSSIMRLR